MWLGIMIGAIIFIVLFGVLSYFLAAYVAHPRCISLEKHREYERENGFLRDYEELEKKEYSVHSFDGYELHAAYIPASKPSSRFVIISHGYTSSRYGSVKYMHMFRAFGFHCVLYDDRRHGMNRSTDCTMGVRESRDLIAVIEDTYRRYGDNIWLGLHGESMGSGLEIMALAYQPKVRFIVNDCGYADLESVLKWKLKQIFHLPGWLVYPASMMCRLFFGYSFTKVRPIDVLPENEVPICFIHGDADDFIDKNHSERMHQATKGYSELHLFPGAAHAECMGTDEQRYYRIVEAFLEKVENA